MEESRDLVDQRIRKLEVLREEGINPFPNDFKVTHTSEDIHKNFGSLPDETLESAGELFTLAGRIMAIRDFGKASFVQVQDRNGRIQAYVRRDIIGDQAFQIFKALDIGDFIGVEGRVFRTKTHELTVRVQAFRLLGKSLRPLPEKWHGLTDIEARYRQRYLDLVANPKVKEVFLTRMKAIEKIRQFFTQRDFIEVETPMLHPIPGGATAKPFKTHHNALDMELYLRVAPELYLKRLVIGGFERIFEINRCFRNEGISTQHNPEFTMLEFYQAYATYNDLMELTEGLMARVAANVTGSTTVSYQGQNIDFSGRWRRLSLYDALVEIGEIPRGILHDRAGLLEFAAQRKVTVTKTGKLGKVITKLFDTLVQPHLLQPTFIIGYPAEVSPLSRRNDQTPDLTERFELFIGGREIANGFSELNDPIDQRARFLQQVKEREDGDAEAHWMDEEYVEALEYGMPPTAGEGVGIDRLAMLLTDVPSIREVILFPHMKPRE